MPRLDFEAIKKSKLRTLSIPLYIDIAKKTPGFWKGAVKGKDACQMLKAKRSYMYVIH